MHMPANGQKHTATDSSFTYLDESKRLRLYAAIALILAVVAITTVLLQSQGQQHGIKNCLGIVLSNYRYSCISSLAQSTGNATLCSYMGKGSASDSCVYNIALNTSNASVCTEISTAGGQDSCIYAVANKTDSYALCSKLNSTAETSCLSHFASRLANVSLCNGIENSTADSICVSAAEISSVYMTSNALECALVSNSTTVATVNSIALYSGVYDYNTSAKVQNSSSLVLGVQSPLGYMQFLPNVTYSARDLCYLYISYKSNNSAYCSEISNSTILGLCTGFLQQNATTRNTTKTVNVSSSSAANSIMNYTQISAVVCANSTLSVQECNSLVVISEAVKTRNASVCTALGGLSGYSCYGALAKVYDNASYCAYITNTSFNSACVQNVYYNSS